MRLSRATKEQEEVIDELLDQVMSMIGKNRMALQPLIERSITKNKIRSFELRDALETVLEKSLESFYSWHQILNQVEKQRMKGYACPRNPAVHEVAVDLIDELLEDGYHIDEVEDVAYYCLKVTGLNEVRYPSQTIVEIETTPEQLRDQKNG